MEAVPLRQVAGADGDGSGGELGAPAPDSVTVVVEGAVLAAGVTDVASERPDEQATSRHKVASVAAVLVGFTVPFSPLTAGTPHGGRRLAPSALPIGGTLCGSGIWATGRR